MVAEVEYLDDIRPSEVAPCQALVPEDREPSDAKVEESIQLRKIGVFYEKAMKLSHDVLKLAVFFS